MNCLRKAGTGDVLFILCSILKTLKDIALISQLSVFRFQNDPIPSSSYSMVTYDVIRCRQGGPQDEGSIFMCWRDLPEE